MKFISKIGILTFWALLFSSCSGSKAAYQEILSFRQNPSEVLIQNVRIFDGKDSVLSPLSQVIIRRGIIEEILPMDGSSHPDIQILDGAGKVLLPGLIDTHVHLGGSGSVPWSPVAPNPTYNLQAYAYAGITSVYELGGMASASHKLSQKVEEGKIPGPHIYFTHLPITVEGAHPIPLARYTTPFPLNRLARWVAPKMEKPEDAEKYVRKWEKLGVSYVKAICDQIPPGSPEMSFSLLKALADAAHQHHLKFIVHIGSPENALEAVRAGADVLAHGVYRGQLTPAQADTLASAGIPMIYTLAGFVNVSQIAQGDFRPVHYDSLLVPPAVLNPVIQEAGYEMTKVPVMGKFSESVVENAPFWKENFDLLYRRGVMILTGTDSALPGTYPGSTFHQEMAELKKMGMSNYEILLGATSRAASMFLEKPNFGVVESGKRADLILVDENPILNLSTLQNPEWVMVGGRILDRTK